MSAFRLDRPGEETLWFASNAAALLVYAALRLKGCKQAVVWEDMESDGPFVAEEGAA